MLRGNDDQLLKHIKANLFSKYLKGNSENLLVFTHPLSPDTGKHICSETEKKTKEIWEQLWF